MLDPLDRLPGGFLAFTDDGLIVQCNKPLLAMLGVGEEIRGRHVESLLTVPSRIFYQTHLLPLLKMQGHLDEVYIACRTAPGEELPVLLNAVRSEIDGIVWNECLLITMGKRSEFEGEILKARNAAERANEEKARLLETLGAANRALEEQQSELAATNAELRALRDTLERRVQERTDELNKLVLEMQGFTYSIAHDLRAPLRAIVTSSVVLSAEAPESFSEENLQLLERQRVNALKLSSLVDDLLQLSRMGFSPFVVQDVDLTKLAQDVWRSLVGAKETSGLTFQVQEGLKATGDRTMLHLLLQNLLENAIKYSPQGGLVEVGEIRHGSECVYFVRDQGIGIDPAYFEKIFQPFQRLHRDVEYPGNGIGLATVERVAQRHGGRVWVDSGPGPGSTFYFTLKRSSGGDLQ
jgi:signal transduction histidine kinase